MYIFLIKYLFYMLHICVHKLNIPQKQLFINFLRWWYKNLFKQKNCLPYTNVCMKHSVISECLQKKCQY